MRGSAAERHRDRRRVPEQARLRYPAVPWEQIVSMRNRLAHEYDGVDMETVWLTVTEDLPEIVRLLDAER